MQTLQEFFIQQSSRDIHTLGRYVQQHIDTQWEALYNGMHQELIDLYQEIGDSAYGVFGDRLFKPVHDQFKLNGFKAVPRLPGNFGMSREWGAEDDRQRWMWSKIVAEGTPIGTLVIAFYHDHLQVRIPRAFRVIAIDAITKAEVIKALSAISPEFKAAREARIEIAEYLASLNNG